MKKPKPKKPLSEPVNPRVPIYEQETIVTYSKQDLKDNTPAQIYTFQEKLKNACLKAGGKLLRTTTTEPEMWVLEVPTKLIRIRFKSTKRAGKTLSSEHLAKLKAGRQAAMPA